MTKIKICGVTNQEDADKCVALGIDAIGFNFFPGSPRYISRVAARKIILSLPPFVTAVGVFVNESLEKIQEIMYYTGIRVIQLSGDETPDFAVKLSRPVIKGIRVGGPEDLKNLYQYSVTAFLLDSPTDKYGGSGVPFHWDLALEAKKEGNVILAGGLTPENVLEAIDKVKPYAVDVCTGVELANGKKDHAKLTAFVTRVKMHERAHRAE